MNIIIIISQSMSGYTDDIYWYIMIIKVVKSKPDSVLWCLCHHQWHSREY